GEIGVGESVRVLGTSVEGGLEVVGEELLIIDADLRSLLGGVTEAEGLADLTEVEPLAEILPLLREPGEVGQLSIDLTATVPQQPGDRIRLPAEVVVERSGGEGRECVGCRGGALDEVAENCVGSHGAHCALRHRSCHGAAATAGRSGGTPPVPGM